MLLPAFALVRRADVVEVIGQALAMVARGAGTRTAAEQVGRPAETVRGWVRRFRERAELLRVLFTVLVAEVAPDPVMPAEAGHPVADAVSAIAGAAVATRSRWPSLVDSNVGEVSVWAFAAAVSHSRLLAPGWPPQVSPVTKLIVNTN
ncbi:helix-turn-helix domain-containing protein [Microbacterium sp. HSID17254]|uniref:helix-turn-helix domain-containing protein n=1 Tax=Microbacterium sp. HSID17254 TaxID=2419509 RepID=UPI001930F239|nr:helix-turn-helix domain-containing protein [Microbacterium sp. HSID17254]